MTPFEQLGLSSDATAHEVKEAWRRLASIHHPDKGGDATEFNRLRTAYHQALVEAETPKPCLVCRGSGRTIVQSGWAHLNMPCDACHGTGELT